MLPSDLTLSNLTESEKTCIVLDQNPSQSYQLTIMHGKFVCLTYPSGAFCVAWSQTLTAAFESLGQQSLCTPTQNGQP